MNDPLNEEFLAQLQADPLATVCRYYAQCLADHPKAIEYLQSNLLLPQQSTDDDSEAAELRSALTIGFADRTLGKRIPSKMIKRGQMIRRQLESLGIYRSNGREHFRGMVTVPLTSISGEVTGIYGRRIDRRSSGIAQQHIGCGLFNAQALQHASEIILTDSVLDAWTFYAAGHRAAVCALDCQLQSEDIKDPRRILLTSSRIDHSMFSGCEIYRIQFPLGHTAHSYAIEP
jgi:DNA primase